MKIIEFFKKILRAISPFAGKTVNYIGGGEALPKPLSVEAESELVRRCAQGDKEAKNKLIEHNLRLVVYIAKKFENTGIDSDDLVSQGTIGLIKAVNGYSPEKGIKLATFASRCIENEVLMYLRKMSKSKTEVSIEEPLNTDSDGNKLVLGDTLGTDSDEVYAALDIGEERKQLFRALDRLGKRDREIVVSRFGLFGHEELTQKEIADKMGISQSYISRLEKRIIALIKKEMMHTGVK